MSTEPSADFGERARSHAEQNTGEEAGECRDDNTTTLRGVHDSHVNKDKNHDSVDDDSTGDGVGVRHRITNIVAVALLLLLLLASVVSVVAGACCLASLHGKPFEHFTIFFTLGVVPVVVGAVVAVAVCVVAALVVCCASGGGCGGVKRYGMCCWHVSCPRATLRVCVYGVVPFVLLIIVIVLAVAGFTIFGLSQQLPDLNKNYVRVEGLRGPVDISRDEVGLTHIRAQSRRDAYFAQGFAEAQDRLFQLEFHRLVGKGELASIAGAAAVETDKAIRILNVREAARALCANMGDDLRNLTQAFADGVNAYLQRERKRPVEFFFLGPRLLRFHEPAPFSYEDVCLTGRLFQWQMSSNMGAEYERFRVWLHSNRTYSEVNDLYLNFSAETTTVLDAAQMAALMVSNKDVPAGKTVEEVIAANAQAQRNGADAEAAAYDGLLTLLKSQLSSVNAAAMRVATGGEGEVGAKVSDSSSSSEQAVGVDRVRARVREMLSAGRVLQQLGGGRGGEARARTLARRNAFAYKFLHASNAWASRDASGHAMVASDAHLTTNLPSVWYYTHMSFPLTEVSATRTSASTAATTTTRRAAAATTAADGDDVGADAAMFDAAGVSLIGLPGVHIGRTNHVAWGITMSMTDLEDLYVLPRTPLVTRNNSYVYGGKVHAFTVREERIRVKGGDDVVVHVRDTVLGPVVNDLFDVPAGLMLVLSAVPLRHDDDTSMRALLDMTNPALDSAEKMMQSLLTLQAPGFSIPIADTRGNIAYAVTGRHPRRNGDHTGKFPTCMCNATQVMASVCVYVKSTRDIHVSPQECVLSADDMKQVSMQSVLSAAYAAIEQGNWTTYISPAVATTTKTTTPAAADDDGAATDAAVVDAVSATADDRFVAVNGNPHVHIPYGGSGDGASTSAAYIVAANHKITPDGYTYHLGDDYAWSYRGQRIAEMLASATAVASTDAGALGNAMTHERIQLDHRSNFFVRDVAAVLQSDAFQRGIADDAAATEWSQRLLQQWHDAQATLGSVEAAFLWRWMQRMSVLPRDALRALGLQHWPTQQRYLVTALTSPTPRMLRECAHELPASAAATGDGGADACVRFAVHNFKQQVAAATTGERWGIDVNHLRGVHELLQGTLLAPVFEREIHKAGDESSVCVSHHSLDDAMLSTQASSMRLLFDLHADAQTVRFALPGGQSGNPYSSYYNNLLDEYAAERYVDTAATPAAYLATSFAAQQTLQP